MFVTFAFRGPSEGRPIGVVRREIGALEAARSEVDAQHKRCRMTGKALRSRCFVLIGFGL
jgi:hypothetical protein